ncbi:MAG TPA: hypothetical protein VF244_00280 [Acidimicrobiales bacterium]
MTTERDRDPSERLRALNPVRAGELDGLVWALPAQALFQRIVAGEELAGAGSEVERAGPRARRGRRGPRVAVLAGVASLSVAVAGYALVGRQSSKPQTVACFATADLRAETAVVGVDRRAGPVAACVGVWARGAFGGVTPPSTLRACILESGVVGVFPQAPGRDVCLDLDLAAAAFPPGPGPSGPSSPSSPSAPGRSGAVDPDRFLAFRDAAQARLGPVCVGPAAAAAIVWEELERAGLRDWTVVTGVPGEGGGFSAERPCASLSFLPEQRTVLIVPLPALPAG